MRQRSTGSEWWRVILDYLGLASVVVLLVAGFSLTAENFFSLQTFRTIANQIPVLIIASAGMTFVLIVRGIDLSVGSVLALSSAVLGVCLVRLGWPLPVALAACLATGAACGAVNGLVTVTWRLPPFIVTLAGLFFARGLALVLCDGSITIDDGFYRALTAWKIPLGRTGLPLTALVFLATLRTQPWKPSGSPNRIFRGRTKSSDCPSRVL